MCEIITIGMAVIFTVLTVIIKKKNSESVIYSTVKTGMLIYWGAALMWFVDCVVAAKEGEPFFDFSREDTILGIMIALIGLAIVALSTLIAYLISKEIEKRRRFAENGIAGKN